MEPKVHQISCRLPETRLFLTLQALGREFRFVFNGVFSPPDKLSHRIPLWTGGGGEQQATYSVEVMTASHTRQATTTSAVDLVIQ